MIVTFQILLRTKATLETCETRVSFSVEIEKFLVKSALLQVLGPKLIPSTNTVKSDGTGDLHLVMVARIVLFVQAPAPSHVNDLSLGSPFDIHSAFVRTVGKALIQTVAPFPNYFLS